MQNTVIPTENDHEVASDKDTEQMVKNRAAIELLQSWFDEDEAEQRETLAQLRVALDLDRITERLNTLYSQEPSKLDPALIELQIRSLPQDEW